MHPVFHIGPVEFPAYFTMLTLSGVVCVLLTWHRARQVGIRPEKIIDLAFIMLLMGVVGARILHILADGFFWDYVHLCTDSLQVAGKSLGSGSNCVTDAQCAGLNLGDICHPEAGTCHPAQDCLRVFKIWYGGLAILGGVVLCIPIGIWYALRHRMGVWRVADIAGFVLPLGIAIGRLGCWFGGCCFGSVCSPSVGVRYPVGSAAYIKQVDQYGVEGARELGWDMLSSLPVHPAPLWSSGFNFLIFGVIYFLVYPRRSCHGAAFWWFLILYGVARFLVEFFRSDDRGTLLGGMLTTSQGIAIPLVLVAALMLRRAKQKFSFSRYPITDPPGRWA
jgi:phosphatidylglycerol:prolipoprotein diacylglycerol transferase